MAVFVISDGFASIYSLSFVSGSRSYSSIHEAREGKRVPTAPLRKACTEAAGAAGIEESMT